MSDAAWPVAHTAPLWWGSLLAALSYALANYFAPASVAFRLGMAATFFWILAGILAGLLTASCHWGLGDSVGHAYCATLQATVLALASLALAWSGSRWQRPELSRLMYPFLLLGAYHLATEDLHEDRKAALFLSLLVYGAVLMAIPRVKRPLQH